MFDKGIAYYHYRPGVFPYARPILWGWLFNKVILAGFCPESIPCFITTDSRLNSSGMTTLLKRGHPELVSGSTDCVVVFEYIVSFV